MRRQVLAHAPASDSVWAEDFGHRRVRKEELLVPSVLEVMPDVGPDLFDEFSSAFPGHRAVSQ